MENLSNEPKRETGRRLLEGLEPGSLEYQLVDALADSLAGSANAAGRFLAYRNLHDQAGEMIRRCRQDKGGEWLGHSYCLPIAELYRQLREQCSQACYLLLDAAASRQTGRQAADYSPEEEFRSLADGISEGAEGLPPTGPVFILDYQEFRDLVLTEEESPRKERLIEEYRSTAGSIKALISGSREDEPRLFYCYRQPLERLSSVCLDLALSVEYAHLHLAD